MDDDETKKLPKGWKWMPFKDVCLINPRKRKDFSREPDEQTSFIPMEAVDDITGRISNAIKRNYSEISKGYTFFEDGDVLFAKITPCMQNGKSAIAQNLIDGVGFGSTEFHVLRPRNNLTKEWIYYYVRTTKFRKEAKDHFEGSAGQQRVPKHFLEDSLIPLPPTLDDQIRIASELERKMAEVETMRQAALRQKEAAAAMQGAILREVFLYKEGDELPEGWVWAELDSLFTIDKQQINKSNTSFNDLQFIGLENIESDTRKYVPSEENEENGSSTCFLFSTKHVLYGKLRPYLNKVYLPDGDGRCSMELLPLLPKNGYSRDFIAAVVQSEIVIAFAVKHSTGGRMPRANMNKINKLKVPIPSSDDKCNYIGNYLNIKFAELYKMRQAAEQQLEAIEALPGAILREVFDFEEDT